MFENFKINHREETYTSTGCASNPQTGSTGHSTIEPLPSPEYLPESENKYTFNMPIVDPEIIGVSDIPTTITKENKDLMVKDQSVTPEPSSIIIFSLILIITFCLCFKKAIQTK